MIAKLPVIRPAVTLGEVCFSLRSAGRPQAREALASSIRRRYAAEDVLLTDSGLSAFYLILLALKKDPGKNEVILPAYTAGSLIVAIRKAGLVPVLCDISLEDFNMDSGAALRLVNDRTLAVLAVHMFGIPHKGIESLRSRLASDVFLIEDCCQAMGSMVNARQVGSFSHVSFHSFNRGKNLPFLGGGCIVSPDRSMAALVRGQEKLLQERGVFSAAGLFAKMAASVIASRPLVYGSAHALLRCFKENAPPDDFSPGGMNCIQAGLGIQVFRRCDEIFRQRHSIGMKMLAGPKRVAGLRLPGIRETDAACFNRMPVLCAEPAQVKVKQAALWKAGIESSPMYGKPLHMMFDLPAGAVPNAEYLASRLLTLPVYPGLGAADIDRICEVMKQ